MRSFAIACAVLLLITATAAAGDLAVSKTTLSDMGLGGLELMSDDAGMAVRGKGTFAGVSGGSQASWALPTQNSGGHWSFGPPPQTIAESTNNYQASAQWLGKDSSAAGGSLSYAVQVEVLFVADPTGFALQAAAAGAVAGGGAFAMAM